MQHDPLLQPLQLKHLQLKNRIISTAHEPAYSEDGLPKRRYRQYHLEKAKGGLAMSMIGGSALVAPDSPPAFGNLQLYRDEAVPYLRELAEALHEQQCAVMCQLTHLGRRSSWAAGDWLPLVAASSLREPAHRAFPKAAEEWDLSRIAAAYAAAAQRCQDAGLDGIELECYGHLLDGFWSPATNQRHDQHNGSLDNRLRFTLHVLSAIRAAVGAQYIVGVRMVVDEQRPDGLQRAEGLQIAQRLAAAGVDFINVIQGHIDSDEGLSQVIPGVGSPAGPHLALAGEVRRAVSVPVLQAARVADLATARYAISAGLVDLIGMTRAQLAEPKLVHYLQTGQEERIRPCVGAGYCIDRIYYGGEALCIHNAATGREHTLGHSIPPATDTKRALVIGAGPAGLEAARVLAERGHQVTVLEAAAQAGGQVRLAASTPRRRELLSMIDWRLSECQRLGVEIHYNHYVEAEELAEWPADMVLIATGGIPDHRAFAASQPYLTSSWDILSGAVPIQREVLLYDDNGAHPGLVVAEALALAGAQLEYVTPERSIAPDVGGTNYPPYLRVLASKGVRFTPCWQLRSVERCGERLQVELYSEYGRCTQRREVDQVVIENATQPLEELYLQLRADASNGGEVDYPALIAQQPQTLQRNPQGRFQLFRLGDAIASRNIHAAVYDALRLCRTL